MLIILSDICWGTPDPPIQPPEGLSGAPVTASHSGGGGRELWKMSLNPPPPPPLRKPFALHPRPCICYPQQNRVQCWLHCCTVSLPRPVMNGAGKGGRGAYTSLGPPTMTYVAPTYVAPSYVPTAGKGAGKGKGKGVGLGKGKGMEAAKGSGKSKGQDALQRQQEKAAATGATAEDALQAMLASLPDAGSLALAQLGSQISMKYPGGWPLRFSHLGTLAKFAEANPYYFTVQVSCLLATCPPPCLITSPLPANSPPIFLTSQQPSPPNQSTLSLILQPPPIPNQSLVRYPDLVTFPSLPHQPSPSTITSPPFSYQSPALS